MKKVGPDRHKSLLSALKKAGFKVNNMERHGKKTVITVTSVVQNAGSVKKPPPKGTTSKNGQHYEQAHDRQYKNMSKSLTVNSTDHSDEKGFSFSFFCDICGKEWRSPNVPYDTGGMTIEHEEARMLLWAKERSAAFEAANVEAHLEFNLCPICGKRVCDECFVAGKNKGDVCKKCC